MELYKYTGYKLYKYIGYKLHKYTGYKRVPSSRRSSLVQHDDRRVVPWSPQLCPLPPGCYNTTELAPGLSEHVPTRPLLPSLPVELWTVGFPQCGTKKVEAKTYVEDVSGNVRLAVVAVGHPQSGQVGHSGSTGLLLQPSLHPPRRQLPIQDPFLGSCDGPQAILPFTRPHWRVTHCTGVKASVGLRYIGCCLTCRRCRRLF